jgi:hypothetical protein
MSNPLAVIPNDKFEMARRRINIALGTIEDGHFDLFSPENVVWLLNAALSDLESARVVEAGARIQASSGLNWNNFRELVED